MVFSPVCCRTLFVARRREESCMSERDELKVRPKVSSLCGATLFISFSFPKTFVSLSIPRSMLSVCWSLSFVSSSTARHAADGNLSPFTDPAEAEEEGEQLSTTTQSSCRHFSTAKREEAERVKEILVFRSRRLHHAADKDVKRVQWLGFWCVLPLKKKEIMDRVFG